MKKYILAFWFILFTIAGFTQTLKFGIKAGLNLSSQSLKSSSFNMDGENLVGFHLGGILDIGYDNFSIQPGLFFTTKGEKITSQLLNSQGENAGVALTKVKLNYLEMPVNLLYKIKVNEASSVFFGGGPYIGYGLSGTVSANDNSSKLNFGNNNDPNTGNYRNPDYGINFTGGVDINNITVGVNYGLGLSNLSYAQGATLHNKVLGFSLGYLFK